jgi:hypothetical protein
MVALVEEARFSTIDNKRILSGISTASQVVLILGQSASAC